MSTDPPIPVPPVIERAQLDMVARQMLRALRALLAADPSVASRAEVSTARRDAAHAIDAATAAGIRSE